MFDKKSLQDNAPRIVAFFVICAALGFDFRSIAANESQRSHQNFDIASAITPVAGILNVAGRIMDHWDNPTKRNNLKMAIPVLPLLVIQTCFSSLSAAHEFDQSIALPSLIGSFCLLCITGLNWESVADTDESPCVSRIKKNAGRIAGVACSLVSGATASASIAFDSKTLFFAASTAASLGGAGESFSRVLDITYFEREKTTLVNKIAAAFFFALVVVSFVLSGLATAKVCDFPIDLVAALSRIHMLFYMVAQYKSSELHESAPLLPIAVHSEEDSTITLTMN
ncbi:MAG: hypothetical protein Q8L78_05025 [Coxiellaceae bacterium]|nr:hypothetical protein [Coxiellaceae bacterium]